MDNKRIKKHIFCFILGFVSVVPSQTIFGQNQIVDVEIELSPILKNSQVLSLTGLGIDDKGSGPVLLSGFLENLTDKKLENLYIELQIQAGSMGVIVDLTQKSSRPFSLQPFQTLYATNNDLANEQIPGISEKVSFDGGLTAEGDELINNLGGSTSLPPDVYSVHLTIFQITNDSGREDLATAFAEIGTNASSFTESEIYLKAPGDIAGSDAEITNKYPQFSWDGASNTDYRLIVVQANGQESPQSLIESAKSSAPIQKGGSLLNFEHADVLINGTSFQYPTSGVQPLEAGNTYYWQVITLLQISGSQEEIASEIWNFSVLDMQSTNAIFGSNEDILELLAQLLDESELNTLMAEGYTLEGLEIDGQQFTGPALLQQIEILVQKVQDEQIILTHN